MAVLAPGVETRTTAKDPTRVCRNDLAMGSGTLDAHVLIDGE